MDIFVKKPVVSIVICFTLTVAGIIAAQRIPLLQFPKIESTSLVISTQFTGASAEVVQGFVTEPIERVAMSVPGVDFVDSNTTAGSSTVTAWLKLTKTVREPLPNYLLVWIKSEFELPPGAEDPAVNVKRADRPNALFYLRISGVDHNNRSDITDYVKRNVNPLFSSISGVQNVEAIGGRDPSMRIWIDPTKLAASGLGANDVLTALRNNNVIASIGRTESDRQQIRLLTNATLQTEEDFGNIPLLTKGTATIKLRDVANVEIEEGPGFSNARSNQSLTVYLAISPLPGANEIQIGDKVYQRLEQINRTMPEGLSISIDYDGTKYMRHALEEIFKTLIETVVLVGLVVFLCMGSLRSSLVPLLTIPVSILGGVAVMYVIGFSLNLLTILAIVLSVGLVVDDAIVVVENVARHIREGKSKFEAALISSRELFAPVVAMTLTLAAVYAPIGFVSGLSGALFREFAFALAITVIMSGIVAVTLSPIMSAYVTRDQGREGRATRVINWMFDRLQTAYAHTLSFAFGWKWQIIFLAGIGSLLLVPFYMFSQQELAPTEDQGSVQIIAEAPPEASLAYTSKELLPVVKTGLSFPEAGTMWQSINESLAFCGIEMVNYKKRSRSTTEMLPEIFGKLSSVAGLKSMPILPSALPSAGQFDVELVVKSTKSYQEMDPYAGRIVQAALKSGMFMFASSSLKLDQPQAKLQLDHDRIADLGLDSQKVSDQLSAFVSEQYVNRFDSNGKAYRVIPMIRSSARKDPSSLLDLQLKTDDGTFIPVRSIAKIDYVTGPRALSRFNQLRSFRIQGGVIPGVTKGQALSKLEELAKEILPEDYAIDYAGESRQLRSEGNSLFGVLAVALAIVYLLLAVQFNSFRLPLVVLLGSVPLALSSAMLFGFLGWTTLNMYAQIGCITLIGLIAKNGILITEFAVEKQKEGLKKIDAVLQAAKVRLRPVLMTTLATVIGHFPLVIVTGAGAASRNCIGLILVAGMAIGTIFTLFVLPCVYLAIVGETKNVDAPAVA